MSQINVLIVVDGEALYNSHKLSLPAGTKKEPINLNTYAQSNNYISLITQNSHINNNTPGNGHEQGQSELTINAKVDDIIQWSVITFDANTKQTPYLYNASFTTVDETNHSNGGTPGITPLTYKTTTEVNYLPPNDKPKSTPTKVNNTIATASGVIITEVSQTLQYNPSFVLVNNSDGTIIGYFSWDPYIVINPSTPK
jgi:hypothetical protein